MDIILYLLCAASAWYGAVKGIKYWIGSDQNPFIYSPLGALLYSLTSMGLYLGYLFTERNTMVDGDRIGAIIILLSIPVLVFPYGMYFSGLVVQMGASFFSPIGSMVVAHTYDKGDTAMARREFSEAEAIFRADLARWPNDAKAVIRLSKALEAQGQPEKACQELKAVRTMLLDNKDQKKDGIAKRIFTQTPTERLHKYQNILAITFCLGDLYTEKFQDTNQAKQLYEQTLQLMYGFPGTDPLRDRIKLLG